MSGKQAVNFSKKQRIEDKKGIDDLVKFAEKQGAKRVSGLRSLIKYLVTGDYFEATLPAYFGQGFEQKHFYKALSEELDMPYAKIEKIMDNLKEIEFIVPIHNDGKIFTGYDLSKAANDAYLGMEIRKYSGKAVRRAA